MFMFYGSLSNKLTYHQKRGNALAYIVAGESKKRYELLINFINGKLLLASKKDLSSG